MTILAVGLRRGGPRPSARSRSLRSFGCASDRARATTARPGRAQPGSERAQVPTSSRQALGSWTDRTLLGLTRSLVRLCSAPACDSVNLDSDSPDWLAPTHNSGRLHQRHQPSMSLAHLLNNDDSSAAPANGDTFSYAQPEAGPELPTSDAGGSVGVAAPAKRKRPSRAAAAFQVDDDPDGLSRRVGILRLGVSTV